MNTAYIGESNINFLELPYFFIFNISRCHRCLSIRQKIQHGFRTWRTVVVAAVRTPGSRRKLRKLRNRAACAYVCVATADLRDLLSLARSLGHVRAIANDPIAIGTTFRKSCNQVNEADVPSIYYQRRAAWTAEIHHGRISQSSAENWCHCY